MSCIEGGHVTTAGQHAGEARRHDWSRGLGTVVSLLAATLLAATLLASAALPAQVTPNCSSCAVWNTPQAPFRIYGNTYYVGTRGLTALLITSSDGHVLIDGGLSESAPLIAASIRALGFRLEDIRAIVNSHVHYDHAGGLAELQRLSGGEVFASSRSAPVLVRGTVGRDDPQYAIAFPIAAVARVRPIPAGDSVRVGDLTLHALATAGHTPGGTSWTWRSCDGHRCLSLVYGDSQSAISADDFLFTKSADYPRALEDFAAGFAALEQVRCDILLTPHPDASAMWDRLAKREGGARDALRDTSACRRYAETARRALDKRVSAERAKMP